tara:strand:+ start:1428 stop:1664 length:237 start_codon:yes stop_codon:yes gene_type:complete
MMTMKEACEYVKTSRIAKAKQHRIVVTKGDLCSGLTTKEYNKVKVKAKGAGSKGRSHSYTGLWNYNNSGIKLNTNYSL